MEIWQIVIYGLVCAAVGLVLGIKIGQIILANKLLPKITELQQYIEQLQKYLKKLGEALKEEHKDVGEEE